MTNFRIQLIVETDGAPETDIEVSKSVEARDAHEALDLARHMLKTENPEINAAKIWAWSIRRDRGMR